MVSTVEGREVPNSDEELGPEYRPHPWQASEDLGLRTVEKPLLDLLVYEFDVVLESQNLCGQLSNDAGGDRLARQGNALRLGGGKSLASDALESFDTAVSEVSGDALVSRSPELCRALVVGQKGKGTSPVQIQRPFQSRRLRQERLSKAGYGPVLVDNEIAAAPEQDT